MSGLTTGPSPASCSGEGLAFFFARLAGNTTPTLHRPVWRARLGPATLALLEGAGLLVSRGPAGWFPCGGACAGPAQRLVHPEPAGPDLWRVECPSLECATEELPGSDLEQLAAPPAALAAWLGARLGASGDAARFPSRPGVEGLGSVTWQGEAREAVLAVGGPRSALLRLLDDLARGRRPALVLAPPVRGLDASVSARHGPDDLVTLVTLSRVLAVEGGALVVPPAPGPLLAVREPAAPPYAARAAAPPVTPVAAPAVARLLEASGPRVLSLPDYEALVARRQGFDLFVDLTAAGAGRGCRAWVRRDGEPGADVDLPAGEAAALVELIEARRALRVGEFRRVQVRAVGKLVERARRRVEGERGPGAWRFFQTISGVEPAAKSYVFRPAAGLTWAAVVAV